MANHISNPDQIQTGQKLAIPGGSDTIDNPDGYHFIVQDEGSTAVIDKRDNTEDKFSIDARDGDDTVYGSGLGDTINGKGGADLLYGDDGNDYLIGSVGSDTLRGQGNNDKLVGGTGADILFGGAGADTFIFDGDSGNDTIKDFVAGTNSNDVIDLSAIGGITSFADLKGDHMVISNGEAIITWGSNHLTIEGIASKAKFDAGDFIFA